MGRKTGGLFDRVAKLQAQSRGLNNASIYAFNALRGGGGGMSNSIPSYVFTIAGVNLTIGGREVDI